MISPEEERRLNAQAYVPEHLVGLMGLISRGEVFLQDDFLCLTRDNWVILVGYPYSGLFDSTRLEEAARGIIAAQKPEYLWGIGPQEFSFLAENITERESDYYYLLDLTDFQVPSSLKRCLVRAQAKLTVGPVKIFSPEHELLTEEFLAQVPLPPRVAALYRAMPSYVPAAPAAFVLEARNQAGRLCAYYVLDLSARDFTTYLVGCYSRVYYEPYASDLLMAQAVELSLAEGKKSINLGLGVNPGIRRFKEKWGGRRARPYHFAEWRFARNERPTLTQLLGRLLGQ
jgi:hypothetical protein